MELEYRFADIDELDFLVRMRIRDLRMFSECAAGTKLEDAIRRFYEIKMKENACRTLLAYAGQTVLFLTTQCVRAKRCGLKMPLAIKLRWCPSET